MATSGSFRSSWRGYTLVTNWECTQNYTHNYSDINVELYLETQSGYNLSVSSRSHTVEIDGSSFNISNSGLNISGGSSKYLGYVSKRVYHEENGTKTITISSYFDMRATIRGTYKNGFGGSETFELSKIPRMSNISDVMDGSRTLGTKHTIHIEKQLSGNITHTAWYLLRGDKGSSGWYYIATNTDKLDLEFTPTTNHIELQPNDEIIYMDIGLDTFKDGEKIGSTSYSTGWFMNIPSEFNPIIKDISIADLNPKTKKLGVYVQNHSLLNVKTNAEGIKGSTVKNILVEIDNLKWNGENISTNEIENYGNIKIKVTVTDTRNRTTSEIRTIQVEEYFLPTIIAFDAERLERNLEIVNVLKNFKIAKLGGKNTVIWKTERRKKGTESWTLIQSGKNFELNRTDAVPKVSEDYEHEFKLTLSDFYSTTEYIVIVYSSFSLLDFHKSGTGLAVGKSAINENQFDIDLETKFRKEVEFEKSIKKKVIEAQLKNSWNNLPGEFNKLSFYKDVNGNVHLQGIVTGGITKWGTVIFTLPEQYRPKRQFFGDVILDDYSLGIARIEPNGDVIRTFGDESQWKKWACFDKITFPTEN
jgi:hypothetical protein